LTAITGDWPKSPSGGAFNCTGSALRRRKGSALSLSYGELQAPQSSCLQGVTTPPPLQPPSEFLPQVLRFFESPANHTWSEHLPPSRWSRSCSLFGRNCDVTGRSAHSARAPWRRSGSQSQRRYRSCGRMERRCSRHPGSQSTVDSNQQQQLRWAQLKRRARLGGLDRARLQPRGGRQAPGIVSRQHGIAKEKNCSLEVISRMCLSMPVTPKCFVCDELRAATGE
jgi:hypothetical protein